MILSLNNIWKFQFRPEAGVHLAVISKCKSLDIVVLVLKDGPTQGAIMLVVDIIYNSRWLNWSNPLPRSTLQEPIRPRAASSGMAMISPISSEATAYVAEEGCNSLRYNSLNTCRRARYTVQALAHYKNPAYQQSYARRNDICRMRVTPASPNPLVMGFPLSKQ